MYRWLTHTFLVLLLILGVGALACPVFSAAHEHEPAELEYKLKAAFLFNFARFTTWPKTAENRAIPFTLCVLGTDPFGAALSGLQERSISGRAIKLYYADHLPNKLDQCQMLFVSKSEAASLSSILKYVNGKPIVTVSDIDGFVAANGMFEFVTTEGRLAFIINNSQAQAHGVHISSSLLNLAYKVQ